MTESHRKQMANIMISIDFEKCFDMIEHQAIMGALSYFNFGPIFTKWIQIMFTHFEVCTQNNGHISDWIKPTWGLHQGCCISPHIFNLMGQIFADLFEQNDKINGVVFHQIKNLLSHFTDDTNIFLSECDSIDEVSHTLAKAESNLGLKVNYEKTTVYRLGSLTNTSAKYYTQKMLAWDDPPISTLGIMVHPDINKMCELNSTPLLSKIDLVLNAWRSRQLTLTGHVLIVNTLVESLFVYKLGVLPVLNEHLAKEIQEKISSYGKGKKLRYPLTY